MKIHTLKLREEYADAVLSGEKSFEIRENDRGYQKGDHVRFKVIDNLKLSVNHPLNDKEYEITYLLHGFGLIGNWCVFAIKEADREQP